MARLLEEFGEEHRSRQRAIVVKNNSMFFLSGHNYIKFQSKKKRDVTQTNNFKGVV